MPGSHLWTVEQRDTWEQWLRPEDVVPIRVPIGSVMLWRNQILHAVAPNLGESERIHLYFGYGPRWMRQTGIMDISKQDPELVAASSPIRRQLLGAMGDGSDTLGADPKNSPQSQHWFVSDCKRSSSSHSLSLERSERSCRADDQVPLRKWAEERAQQGTPIDWGLGHGAPFAITNSSPAKVASDEGKAVEDVVAGMLPAGSHAYRNFQNTTMREEWYSGAPYTKCVPSPRPGAALRASILKVACAAAERSRTLSGKGCRWARRSRRRFRRCARSCRSSRARRRRRRSKRMTAASERRCAPC